MAPKNIQRHRLQLRMSQTRLAALSRVSRFKICLYERGDLPLSGFELQRINEVLRREAELLRNQAQQIMKGFQA